VSKGDLAAIIYKIRKELNPHPAGQLSSNVPTFEDRPVPGVQHKYKQTALVFPSAGQQCHSYCTFCFRWPQFIGESDLKFATDSQMTYLKYLREHEELTDVLFTGGDPMVMSAKLLEKHLAPLLTPDYNHIQNIRIGSKSLSYWPQRFVSDKDSNEVLDLFKRINDSGKQLAFMAHINHINELQTDIVQEAIYKIRQTGTQIRTQAPLLRHINDDSAMWANKWKLQVRLGMIPYYFFIERDTGPKNYFSLPLAKTWEIYKNALQEVSGLARTVRGPSMSATPGKVAIEGMNVINGEKVFVLTLLQARNPNHIKKPFLAKFDEKAIWFDQLVPAFGESMFFFEK
jgi:KamA family protein